MSAQRLREAAALMRSRAEKAEQGRWKLWGMTVMADPKGTSNLDDGIGVCQAFTPSWCDQLPRTWNAEHIASWHPAVALAVADLLEDEAHWLTCEGCGASKDRCKRIREDGYIKCCPDCAHGKDALAVANAYLQEASDV